MTPQSGQDRPLREQAAVLATEVSGTSEKLGNVSKDLTSLQTYGHRNRTMIIVTIISLVIDLSLKVSLAVVKPNVIDNNQRPNASVGSINFLTKSLAEVLARRSAFYDTCIAALNLRSVALAKDVTAQENNGSTAERHKAQVRYLADIATINKIKIPPPPVFNPHC